MAELEYISVLEDIKQLVLDYKLSYRGVCTEAEFDATVERFRFKQVKWKTSDQDLQNRIEWNVWLYYFLDYDNAEAIVDLLGRFRIAVDDPRARKFRLVEMRIVLSKFEERNDWKTKIEKLKKEEKSLRAEGEYEVKKLMNNALDKKRRSFLDFEHEQRKRVVELVHQFHKDRVDGVRKEIDASKIELEMMKEYVKKQLEDIHKQLKAMNENGENA
ncbi:hypothetical protein BOTCAL_0006g00120 [Botryotinia calthae]|uniref:Uncharacterized protein n=1 Tax=Botryotinia calthae TaxID=38488 RepID=A0A4Y8DJM1_9HELO|nr:hypothetical protein BOTCAL_0006g00120 [Botryotinia calthae]